MVCQRSNQNEILRGNKDDQNVRVRMVALYHKVQLRSKVDGWYGKLRGKFRFRLKRTGVKKLVENALTLQGAINCRHVFVLRCVLLRFYQQHDFRLLMSGICYLRQQVLEIEGNLAAVLCNLLWKKLQGRG